jgi:hypothetical protein
MRCHILRLEPGTVATPTLEVPMSTLLRSPQPPRSYELSRDRGPLDRAAALPRTPRRRGRPPMMTREEVLEQIRSAASADALFRVHLDQPALYARARRLWGTWAAAVATAGFDYEKTIAEARRRAIASRRKPQLEEDVHA